MLRLCKSDLASEPKTIGQAVSYDIGLGSGPDTYIGCPGKKRGSLFGASSVFQSLSILAIYCSSIVLLQNVIV